MGDVKNPKKIGKKSDEFLSWLSFSVRLTAKSLIRSARLKLPQTLIDCPNWRMRCQYLKHGDSWTMGQNLVLLVMACDGIEMVFCSYNLCVSLLKGKGFDLCLESMTKRRLETQRGSIRRKLGLGLVPVITFCIVQKLQCTGYDRATAERVGGMFLFDSQALLRWREQ